MSCIAARSAHKLDAAMRVAKEQAQIKNVETHPQLTVNILTVHLPNHSAQTTTSIPSNPLLSRRTYSGDGM
jgi:hypothetical protein